MLGPNRFARLLAAALLFLSMPSLAHAVTPRCPSGAPPIHPVLEELRSARATLIIYREPIDGETISGSPLSRDNWFAIQRIQFDRRVSFGIGSGRNQFWLYRNAEGANLVVLAARECHLGTLYRPDQARSA